MKYERLTGESIYQVCQVDVLMICLQILVTHSIHSLFSPDKNVDVYCYTCQNIFFCILITKQNLSPMSCCGDTSYLDGFIEDNLKVGVSLFGRFYFKNLFYTDSFFNLMQPFLRRGIWSCIYGECLTKNFGWQSQRFYNNPIKINSIILFSL